MRVPKLDAPSAWQVIEGRMDDFVLVYASLSTTL